MSVCRSRHTIPQSVSPVGQPDWQTPPLHAWPPPQLLPHEPQLRESVCVSTHWLLQSVKPEPHVQVPVTQLAPLGQAVPHEPQSNGSVCKSTQALLQSVRPVPQDVVHDPPEQT